MLQLPDESASHGFDGATVAPEGRPLSVIDSDGSAVPHTLEGVTPPDHASDDANTMCDPNTQVSGPQELDEQSAKATGVDAAARRSTNVRAMFLS